jgi:hypothetical protein
MSLSSPSNSNNFAKDKSSTIRVDFTPNGGILIKQKQRSPKATEREMAILDLVHQVLDIHNQGSPDIHILSPIPIPSETNDVHMSFIPGINGESLTSRNYHIGSELLVNHYQICERFFEALGRLLHIKELERWVHSDFQLRHVLYDVDETPSQLEIRDHLGFIDLENLHIPTKVSSSDSHLIFFDIMIKKITDYATNNLSNQSGITNQSLDLLKSHPLFNKSLMDEHLKFLDQLFCYHPVLYSKSEHNGTRPLPYSIYGVFRGKNIQRTNIDPQEAKEKVRLSSNHRSVLLGYRLLKAIQRGYDSLCNEISSRAKIAKTVEEVQYKYPTVDFAISNKDKW